MLSIIVTTYKNVPLAKKCIASVITSCQQSNISFEIILSDTTSTPKKIKALKVMQKQYSKHITHVLRHKDNIGYARSVNAGIKKAKGDCYLAMNSDIIVLEDAIPKMYSYIKKNKEVGILGPKLLNIDKTLMMSAYRYYQPLDIVLRRTFLGKTAWGKKRIDHFLMKEWDHAKTRKVDWLQGSAMMITRENLEIIGAIDNKFFLYFEDLEWCRRAWQSRKTIVYYPEAAMIHHHRQESSNKNALVSLLTNKLTRAHIKSALYYIKKYKKFPFPRSYKDLI